MSCLHLQASLLKLTLIQSALDFLRVSRTAVDDTINQNLNALITPGSRDFDPTITNERQLRPTGRRSIDPQACAEFKDRVLFPSWQSRSDVLNYCAGVATSPDPDDPDHVLRQVEDTRAWERVVTIAWGGRVVVSAATMSALEVGVPLTRVRLG